MKGTKKRKKPGNSWRRVPLILGGGKQRKYKDSRYHKHLLKDDKHLDVKDPYKDPAGHFAKDILGRGKGAPVTTEWTQRYRMINGRRRLVLVRTVNGNVKIRINK